MIAAIYARKSTDQHDVADEDRSITRQVDHARAYAVGKGWTVVDEHLYVDDGVSGAEFTNRPGFLRLMNALKPAPPFQVLIMSEESRPRPNQLWVSDFTYVATWRGFVYVAFVIRRVRATHCRLARCNRWRRADRSVPSLPWVPLSRRGHPRCPVHAAPTASLHRARR